VENRGGEPFRFLKGALYNIIVDITREATLYLNWIPF